MPRVRTILGAQATYTWQQLSMELALHGRKHSLVVVDRYSGWPEKVELGHLDTKAVTITLEKLFKTFGIPEIVCLDGGQQFRSELREWCQGWDIKPEGSSPHHLPSNGHTEWVVGLIKTQLKKSGNREALG